MFDVKGYELIDLNFGFEASLIVQTFEECVKIRLAGVKNQYSSYTVIDKKKKDLIKRHTCWSYDIDIFA